MRLPCNCFARQHEGEDFFLPDPLSPVREIAFVSNHAVLDLELGRRGAHVNDLVRYLHELVEVERAIIERARKPEAVLDEHGLARAIAFVHAADLRDGGVRFVDNGEKIFREKVDDRVGLGSRRAARQVARVVFDPVAKAHLLQHFQIVLGANPEPLGFEQFVLRLEHFDPVFQFGANGLQSAV